MNPATRLQLASLTAFTLCIAAVGLGAELTSTPVATPTRTIAPAFTPTVTSTRTPATDGCRKEWHGQIINCCVKRHPGPPCDPEKCAKMGGACEMDPCGHSRCWTGVIATPAPTKPRPTPAPTPKGECARSDCPNAPGMPNWECADGRRGGPACTRFEDGKCGWVIVDCAPKTVPAKGEIRGEVGYQHDAIDYSALPNHEVIVRSEGRVVRTLRSDGAGRFRLDLPPGRYVVSTSFANVPHVGPKDVEVEVLLEAGKSFEVRLSASDGTRCLPGGTPIDTPSGPVAVRDIALGALVRSHDGGTNIVYARGRVTASPSARVVRVVLADGRSLEASGLHPLAGGRLLSSLREGDLVDGSRVRSVESVALDDGWTWDIATERGYVSGGIPLASTLQAP